MSNEASPKKSSNAVVVGVVLVTVVAAVWFTQRKKHAPPTEPAESMSNNEVYAGMASVYQAVMNAPEGATTCETGWNAYEAMEKALAGAGQPSSVEKHPDKKTYLEVCEGFTGIEQQCLVPRFKNNNLDRCQSEGQLVWSEADALKRKNLVTIFGRRTPGGVPLGTKPDSGSD